MGISFYCKKCRKKFSASSVDRKRTAGRSVFSVTCPRCGARIHKRVGRAR